MTPTVESIVYRAGRGSSSGAVDADPITTEVIRHGLDSAAKQMKRALIRTAFSPVIYEVLDFAVAIYDRQVRLLAQAPSLPFFMGTMNFCVEAAVAAVGGEDALEPGDIVLYNCPYGTGSHPQDAAVVMPVFLHDEELIGYTAIKGHWLDIGGKEPYSTDTVDVFQEGTIFPGVKLYQRGELVDDIYRMAIANSRVPKMVAGDINAEVVGVRTGAAGFLRLVERYGLETFGAAVERMFDHGEAVVRSYFEQFPDGRYVGQARWTTTASTTTRCRSRSSFEVDGSTVRARLLERARRTGRARSTARSPSTVSASRIAITMLAGSGESPNEGHFRPIEVVARPGSLFHPRHRRPASCTAGPATRRWRSSTRRSREAHARGRAGLQRRRHLLARLVGRARGDGRALGGRLAAPGRAGRVGARRRREQPDARTARRRRASRRPRSGRRRTRGCSRRSSSRPTRAAPASTAAGSASTCSSTCCEDSYVTSAIERTKTAPWGSTAAARRARTTSCSASPTERARTSARRRGCSSRRERRSSSTRRRRRVQGAGANGTRAPCCDDVREGYVSERHARRFYPHAFPTDDAS